MPQVDLESLVAVCAGGSCDRKITCETLTGGDPQPPPPDPPENPPDFPPDSFWLSKDAELDWFDRNAFIERKDSTKGHSISAVLNPNPSPSLNSISSSQRFSVAFKSKASILGLPKPQKACFSDAKLRRNSRQPNARLFPKRSSAAPEGKSAAVPVAEPSSPKVSCMGRVRSKKDRSRRCRSRSRKVSGVESVGKAEKAARRRRTAGLWTSLTGIFRSGDKQNRKQNRTAPPKADEWTGKSSESPMPALRRAGSRPAEEAEAPGLGAVKRFASGRRLESWGIVDSDSEIDVAKSCALAGNAVLGRRGMDPLKEIECRRGLETVAPASV